MKTHKSITEDRVLEAVDTCEHCGKPTVYGAAIIKQYKTGKRDFAGANLRGANLLGASLHAADLRGADLCNADLRHAYLCNANLLGASLRGADLSNANLRGADLRGANLSNADLSNADLRYADLYCADLYCADLRGANLFLANLGQGNWIIQGPCRSDGYWFFFQKIHGETVPMVKAGCRYFTMEEAFAHWAITRGGTKLGDETMEILHSLWSIAYHRRYINEDGSVK